MAQKIKFDKVEKSNLDIMFDLLGGVGVESFVVTFDGGGDDGQIEESSEFKPQKKSVLKKAEALLEEVVEGAKVSNGTRYGPNGSEQMWKENPTLNEIIESVCYESLEKVSGGWEINEGSYGSFHFDVKKRKMTLDFNERVIDSNNFQYES